MPTKTLSPPGAVPPPVQASVAHYRRLTRWMAVLTVLVVGAWLVGGLCVLRHGATSGTDHNGTANSTERLSGKSASPGNGPWGEIVYVPMMISPPMEFVPVYAPFERRDVVWNFPNATTAQFGDLLGQIGLPDELKTKLRSMAELNPSINGLSLRPSRELVLGLSPEARAGLYVAMGFSSENPDQANAFRYRGTSLDEWLDGAAISPETKRLLAPLIYRHGRYLFFADLRSIEESLPSAGERLALVKALSREATFLARLKITPESDIDALVNYWGRGGRAKDVRPILESLALMEGGQTLNIAQLLPPFAQRRLYTYPPPPEKGAAVKHDCHWTTMNFFSEEPDDRFCVPAETTRTLDQDYYPVYGNLQLGDIVMFCSNQTVAIHSAVYLADDILFTKNGNTSTRPWMLMKLEDMKEFYPSHKPLTLRCYRRKGL